MKCKIVSVDLDNRSEKILCPKCKSEIPLDDGLANCEKLRLIIFYQVSPVTASSLADNSKPQLTCPLLLLEQVSGKKLNDQIVSIRSLIKTPFDVVYKGES